jgi:hypothetical protein
MASVSYTTRLSERGPWFLENGNLSELDEVVASCIESMKIRREESIKLAIAREREYWGERADSTIRSRMSLRRLL